MTKKIWLGISAFFNLCIFGFLVYSTYLIRVALVDGTQVKGIAAVFSQFPLDVAVAIYSGAIIFAAITFFCKLLAEHLENNGMTVFVMMLDLILIALLMYLAKDSLPHIFGGNFVDYTTLTVLLGTAVLTLVLDIFSIPAKRW